MAGSDDGKLVGDFGVEREEFAYIDGIGFSANRFEGAADFARGVRLHVPEIDVTGAAEIEDHDAGGVFLAGFDEAGFFGGEKLRQREADRGERADLEEFAAIQARPAKTRTILWGFGEEIEHGWILAEFLADRNG